MSNTSTAMKRLFLSLLLCAALLPACRKTDVFVDPTPYSLDTKGRMADDLVSGTPDYFGHIKSEKQINLAPGVDLLDLFYLNKKGYSVRMCLYKVALGDCSLAVALPGGVLKSERPSVMAENLNHNALVIGAVNGDVLSGENPCGIVYRHGSAVKDDFSDSQGGFFAILKDGTAAIGTQAQYPGLRSSLYSAIGTRDRILTDG